MSTLARQLLAIDEALTQAGIPHAFGGAIALAYCTGEPWATIDLDINVFVPHDAPDTATAALPEEVAFGRPNRKDLRERGQTRAWWDTTGD